jgi:hypothetical protein
MFPDQPGQYPDQPYGHYEPVADDRQALPTSPGPYPPAYPPAYQQPPQQIIINQPSRPTSTYATISLVFGILGFLTSCCTFGVFSAVALICGLAAMRETNNDAKGGRSMAIVGLILGGLGIVFPIFFFISGVTGNLMHPAPTTTP